MVGYDLTLLFGGGLGWRFRVHLRIHCIKFEVTTVAFARKRCGHH
jgi:hypothetical protein